MSVSRRSFALALALQPGVGGKTVSRVLARNDLLGIAPEEFLGLSSEALREEYRIPKAVAERLASKGRAVLEESWEMEQRLNRHGVAWVCLADVHYPRQIESFDPDPPGALFLYGNTQLLSVRTFAVMASRGGGPGVLDRIELLTQEGVLASEVAVSGHDRPEYQRAAVVPLRWGAPRILVLDRGLFPALGEDLEQEPFAGARLWRYRFDPQTDLVVSPVKPTAGLVGVSNQVRDRLIAALAGRIDFAHIAAGGNMERIARAALQAGKPVRLPGDDPTLAPLRQLGAETIP
ncbi:MAG: hypothetical protein N2109_04695 [Fimbriimonadales bacterium]|nr:hypothetical protein [Fimbriimonadales bacterium]